MDISQITDYLFIGAEPSRDPADAFRASKVGLIISMIGSRQPPVALTQPPHRLLWLRTMDAPFAPIPLGALAQGVETALPVIKDGGSVFVYCAKGRHRSVAMGAAILIAMGHSSCEAVDLIRTQRAVADPQARHIHQRILHFEQYWQGRAYRQNFPDRLYEGYCVSAASTISQIVLRLGLDRGTWTT